ncbi:DNA primase [Flavobacterium sp. CBA20B-1]|uniref:DNA primase n=1 Tax=unclassified Flavobacterium TaxID=196869 RepID=UPI002225A821|nr:MULTISPECIES: DNA primase [unclassified Flavobacterium]WCM43403.1 DNA primase [Flavobacterium sp. CBA20B-1]
MIKKETIDAIFEAARVEEVIGDFVQLKKSGSNYKGLSPFVNEKTPSFMVSPAKQIWKDFSSGKGGNAISFIMEHEHFSYPEALRYLANKYQIEIEETEQTDLEKQALNERESLFVVSEFAKKYFHDVLLKTDEGLAIGHSYFKERGFTEETIKTFQLGYSPDQWDAFTKEALAKGYQLEFLEKSGLTIVKDDKTFDRFKERVMFPIQSMSGRVLGFGGRILTNDKKAAKYLNSPESDIYHKSKVLYGIFHAKQEIASKDNCYLVEGYTDVIQMHQAGIKNVVASSGTALTPDQIRLINRLTKNITVLFDGDAAGMRASLRGIDLILEAGMNVRVCTFPDGDDPDSFARKTPIDELQHYLKDYATDFIRFKANLLMKDAGNDPIKKADVIRDIVVSISKVPDHIQREVYVQECASIMDISEDVLFSTLAQIGKKELQEANKKFVQDKKMEVVRPEADQPKEQVNIIYLLERKIIEILLIYGNYEELFNEYELTIENEKVVTREKRVKRKVFDKVFLSLQEDEVEMSNEKFKAIFKDILSFYHTNESWNLESYLQQVKPELTDEITSIIMDEERYNLHSWEKQNIIVKGKDLGVQQYVNETILTLRSYLIFDIIEDLKKQIHENPEKARDLLADIVDYNNLKHTFSTQLGRVMSRFS